MHGVIGSDQFAELAGKLAVMAPARARAMTAEVAEKHGVEAPFLLKDIRFIEVVIARNELIHRLRHEIGWSWERIGRFMGKDHTSCIYAARRHAAKTDGTKTSPRRPRSNSRRFVTAEQYTQHLRKRRADHAWRLKNDRAYREKMLVKKRARQMKEARDRLLMAMM